MQADINRSSTARSRRRLGAISTEYLLVLACIVIPLALWVPTLMRMTGMYCHRIVSVIALPFGASF
jgi:hypothetical protein